MKCLLLIACLLDPVVADNPSVDRGSVRIGPPLTQTFRITNTADLPVELTGVSSSCGCLAPKLDRQQLARGEAATLTVEVNTLSQPAGPIAWVTRVGWKSGEASGELALTLRATLTAEVRVEPAALAFHVRQARSVDVKVTDTRDKPFKIISTGTTLGDLSAEVQPGADPHVHTLRVTAKSGGTAGVHQAIAWFTTDDPLYPQVRIPVTLHVPAKTRVTASPSVLFLNGDQGRVLLRDRDGQPVRIDQIATEGPLAVTTNESIVTVRVDKKKWNGQPASGRVIVSVSSPVVETISVNVDIR